MKQFDDIFKEQLQSAFDKSDYSHLAEEGWKSFTEKRKGGKKLAIVIPFWAKAASVALILSVGSLFVYKSFNDRPVTIAEYSMPGEVPVKSAPVTKSETVKSDVVSEGKSINGQPGRSKAENGVVNLLTVNKTEPEIDSILPAVSEQEINNEADTIRKSEQVYEEKVAENRVPEEKAKANPLAEPAAEETISNRKTSLIAGFAGIMSEAGNNSSSTPGVSVGFFIDQKLSRRISFRPGLALSKFAYASVPVASAKVMGNAYAAMSNSQAPVESNDNKLDIITMEIPLNMVFTVLEKGRSSLFVSAGASTLVYLNQQFSGDYVGLFTQKSYDAVTGAVVETTVPQTVNVKSEENAFSHVDYFGLANLSAGYSMPVGKSNMLIEPFIQLPVSDLTSLDLKIKYGGLSVKYRFGR
jgi:hypothetical protein